MTNVFLSSTFSDLQDHREEVHSAISQLPGYTCTRMEDFPASPDTPEVFCRNIAKQCDLFVGIVGHYFGSGPPDSDKSFTQIEYEAVGDARKPRLMFLAPDDFHMDAKLREDDNKWIKQKKFREVIEQEVVCNYFRNPDDLARRVIASLWNWEWNKGSSSGVGLVQHVMEWFETLGFEFEGNGVWDGDCFEWTISFCDYRGRHRISVRCVEAEAQLPHLDALHLTVVNQNTDEGWLIVPLRKGPAVLRALDSNDRVSLNCFTFDELISNYARFDKYFEWLENEVVSRGIDMQYIPLACRKGEMIREAGQSLASYIIDANEGGLEAVTNSWVDDSSKEHLSILGEFGTGKTWFALHYAWKCLKEYREAEQHNRKRPRIPIYVALRDYSGLRSIEALFSELFFRKAGFGPPSYDAFEYLNRIGKLLILFDGFDEMALKVDRQTRIDNFWQLARVVVPGSKVVLTCRTEHFPEAIEGRKLLGAQLNSATVRLTGEPPQFEVVELEMLNEDQIRRILRNNRASNEIIEKILADDELKQLARRPLMIEYILEALPEVKSMSRVSTAHVYRIAIRRKMARDIEAERTFTSLADKLFFLCEISWEMSLSGELRMHYKEFPRQLGRLFGDRVLEERDLDHWGHDMMNQTLFSRTADGNYFPAHRSLVEFFVAYKYVAQLGVMAPEFTELAKNQSNLDDTREETYTWSEYFTRKKDATGNVIRIAKLKDFVVDEGALRNDPEPFDRLSKVSRNALVFASTMLSREPEALARLCEMCWARGDNIAWKALELLPFLKESAETITQLLVQRKTDSWLRPGVTWVLGELNVASEEVCTALSDTVEAFSSGRPVNPLSWWESGFALRKLGQLECDPEEDQEATLAFLARNRPPGYALNTSLDRVTRHLRDPDKRGKRLNPCDVVTIAQEWGERDTANLYRDYLHHAEIATNVSGRQSYDVIWLCGFLRVKDAAPDIVHATKHPQRSIRNCAAEALGRIGVKSKDVLEALRSLLEDDYYRARFHAALAIRELRAVECIGDLKTAIRYEEVPSVKKAIKARMKLLEEAKR